MEDQKKSQPNPKGPPLFLLFFFVIILSGGVAASTFFVMHLFFKKPENLEKEKQEAGTQEAGNTEEKVETKHEEDEIQDEEKPAEKEDSTSSSSTSIQTFSFGAVQVNIGQDLQTNFLRVVPVIEFSGGEEQLKEIEERQHILRDKIIQKFSQEKRENLLDYRKRDVLKQDLEQNFNELLPTPINAVYFTEFLVD